MNIWKSYLYDWCFIVFLDVHVSCWVLLFSFAGGVKEMVRVVVLSRGFIEVIELILLSFCCTTMCLCAIEEGQRGNNTQLSKTNILDLLNFCL